LYSFLRDLQLSGSAEVGSPCLRLWMCSALNACTLMDIPRRNADNGTCVPCLKADATGRAAPPAAAIDLRQ
jgi:hypothetical protein